MLNSALAPQSSKINLTNITLRVLNITPGGNNNSAVFGSLPQAVGIKHLLKCKTDTIVK